MIEKNENTAELVGLSFGDGSLTYRTGNRRLRFQLRGSLKEDKEHYDSYVIPLFDKEIMNPIFNGKKVGIVFNKNAGFYGISKESKKLKLLNDSLGIPIGVKKDLFIPGWIKDDKKYTNRFLRGFFDTDGSISCQRNYSIKNNRFHTQVRISLSCCSNSLIKEIQDLLTLSGFKCLLKKYVWREKKWSIVYSLVLSGGIQVDRWFKFIGSKNPKHLTKYKIWKEFGFCPPFTTLIERKQILKKEISPYFWYKRECRSGQTGMSFHNKKLPS